MGLGVAHVVASVKFYMEGTQVEDHGWVSHGGIPESSHLVRPKKTGKMAPYQKLWQSRFHIQRNLNRKNPARPLATKQRNLATKEPKEPKLWWCFWGLSLFYFRLHLQKKKANSQDRSYLQGQRNLSSKTNMSEHQGYLDSEDKPKSRTSQKATQKRLQKSPDAL